MDTPKPLSGAERMAAAETRIAELEANAENDAKIISGLDTAVHNLTAAIRALINAQGMNSAYDRWEHVKPMLEQLS